MVPMPMRQLDQLNRGEIRPQSLHVPLPYVAFRAGIEEHGMLFVAFGSCLHCTSHA
jgi:hypothetical protein